MGSRVRRPETDILTISGGDTLTVKRFLTAGEFRVLMRAATKPIHLDAGATPSVDLEIELDPTETAVAMVLAYLLDWTFTDYNGSPLVIRDQPTAVVRGLLDAIDAQSYLEVQQAIQAHDQAVRAFIAAEKKTSSGATAPAPTSPSVG